MLILFEGQAKSGVTTLIYEFIRQFPFAVYMSEPPIFDDDLNQNSYFDNTDIIEAMLDGRSTHRKRVFNEINSRLIVSDRFIDEDYIKYTSQIINDFKIPPDLTVIVDVDPAIARQRLMKWLIAEIKKLPPIKVRMVTSPSSDTIIEYNHNTYQEAEKLAEHQIIGQKFRSRFLDLPNIYPERQFIIVDGNDPIESARKIYQKIQSLK